MLQATDVGLKEWNILGVPVRIRDSLCRAAPQVSIEQLDIIVLYDPIVV